MIKLDHVLYHWPERERDDALFDLLDDELRQARTLIEARLRAQISRETVVLRRLLKPKHTVLH